MRAVRRREFLIGAGATLGAWALGGPRARALEEFELPQRTREALATSGFVYVSPLLASGTESRCHGEVWFLDHGDDVVLVTEKGTWKSRALARGYDRARIWVGNYGRGGEAFRAGPSFLARASLDTDPAVFERLMTVYAQKYPDEWGKWQPRFRSGMASGDRVMIRYTAVGV